MTHFEANFETKAYPSIPLDTKEQPAKDKRVDHILGHLSHLQETLEKKFDTKMQTTQNYLEEIFKQSQRPLLSGEVQENYGQNYEQKQYHTALFDYIKGGNEQSLRNLDSKAYRGDFNGGDGGFLVTPRMNEMIYRTIDTLSPMRKIANIVNTQFGTLDFLTDPDNFGGTWAAETAARPETTTSLLRKISIGVHELYALPKATQRLLDDSAFNLEEWISLRVAERFAQAENNAFIAGDGVAKPFGILSKPQVDNATYTWGNIGFVKTGAAAGLNTAKPHDVLLDAVYALPALYRTEAVWLMNSKTACELRKFKDVDGRYLWQDMFTGDKNHMLMGYDVVISEDMPDIAANSTPIAFGNFKKGYTIVDGNDIRLLRDPYTAKPHVFFYTVKRVGGDVTDFNAIKLIKCIA